MIFPLKPSFIGDFPVSHVSLLEGKFPFQQYWRPVNRRRFSASPSNLDDSHWFTIDVWGYWYVLMIEPFLDILFIEFFFWVACVKTDRNRWRFWSIPENPNGDLRPPQAKWMPACSLNTAPKRTNSPYIFEPKGWGKKHGHLDHESIIYDLSWTRQFCGLPKLTV